jgi:uncharacterized protein YcbK (DUF882 family)
VIAFMSAAVAVVGLRAPSDLPIRKPFEALAIARAVGAEPSADAFGTSGEVKLRVVLPGERVEYPLEVEGDPAKLTYSWVRTGGDKLATVPVALTGAELLAPTEPGMYHLALLQDGQRRVVKDVTVGVLVPFAEKLGTTLNGYKIGTYLAERVTGRHHDAPEGFLQVGPEDVDMQVTTHLRVSDFLNHDGQSTWPRYVALEPRLLDKLELVIAQVSRMQGRDSTERSAALDVHSGFRTPSHNFTVKRSARDSRHQYGDAADVTIDANFDGRYTIADSRLVALAVEMVEQDHPELRGGMGVYNSRRYSTPYVHIDARGTRARWRG